VSALLALTGVTGACSYDDPAAARSALQGVDVLFMVSAAEAEDRRAQHRTFIAAAAEAGHEPRSLEEALAGS